MLQCGLPVPAAGALERGAAAGAEGIEPEGRAIVPAELPRKLLELAPESPAEVPPRLNPPFAPARAPSFIRASDIGAGLRGIEGADGMAFTARKFSRMGMEAAREFNGIVANPARAGIVPAFAVMDARRAATLPTVGANILAGALAPRTF